MSTTTTATQESASTSASSAAAAGSSTTLATSTVAPSSSSSSSFSSPAAVTAALTTTFTPPASCTEQHLSLLSSPGYFMWLNEPSPVPGTFVTDCYPPQFISGYSSVFNASSSIAPVMSPLVCPQAWHTVNTFTSNYIACCPEGFLLALPSTTVDTNRPAYGGTCYSSFTVGKTVNVTAYNSVSITATQEWVASSTADQAYGHVIEGFALEQAAVSSSTAAASSSNKLSGGAIAGIVIGVVAFVALLLGAALWFFRRRRAAARKASPGDSHEVDGGDAVHEKTGDNDFRKELSGASADPKAELEGPLPVHELEACGPAELDGGWKGTEVHTPGTEKEVERRREMLSAEEREASRLESARTREEENTVGTYKATSHDDDTPRTPPPAY
ncbi:hypothetical protein GTA08_BOTSDO09120 [Neofusicoccum parvum]|nr:hypothetical protein GTA08_BOTSDO09120 [Neofusicoccum parvum]